MGSNSVACVALLLSLNLLFFSMVSSQAPPPAPVTTQPQQPSQSPPPPARECPELGVCLDILGLGGRLTGSPPSGCCPILGGLVEAGALVCICDQLRLNLVGIPINIALRLILNSCGQNTSNLICN